MRHHCQANNFLIKICRGGDLPLIVAIDLQPMAPIEGIDLQPMAPIEGVIQVQGDITNARTAEVVSQFPPPSHFYPLFF